MGHPNTHGCTQRYSAMVKMLLGCSVRQFTSTLTQLSKPVFSVSLLCPHQFQELRRPVDWTEPLLWVNYYKNLCQATGVHISTYSWQVVFLLSFIHQFLALSPFRGKTQCCIELCILDSGYCLLQAAQVQHTFF